MTIGNYHDSADWKQSASESQKNEEFMLKIRALAKSREDLKKENQMLKERMKNLESSASQLKRKLAQALQEKDTLEISVAELEESLSKQQSKQNVTMEKRMEELAQNLQASNELVDRMGEVIIALKDQIEDQNDNQDFSYEYEYNRPQKQYRDRRDYQSKPEKEFDRMREDLNDVMFSINKRLDMMEDRPHGLNRKKNYR